MSKSILIVNKPTNCLNCDLFDENKMECPYAGVKYSFSKIPDKCKLIPADEYFQLKYEKYLREYNVLTFDEFCKYVTKEN